jgi:hypothetical protein
MKKMNAGLGLSRLLLAVAFIGVDEVTAEIPGISLRKN